MRQRVFRGKRGAAAPGEALPVGERPSWPPKPVTPVRPARGGEAILIALILSHHLPLIVT